MNHGPGYGQQYGFDIITQVRKDLFLLAITDMGTMGITDTIMDTITDIIIDTFIEQDNKYSILFNFRKGQVQFYHFTTLNEDK